MTSATAMKDSTLSINDPPHHNPSLVQQELLDTFDLSACTEMAQCKTVCQRMEATLGTSAHIPQIRFANPIPIWACQLG